VAVLLGRKEATDAKHLQRFSLTADTMPEKPTPVVLGTAWYRAFFTPWRDSDGVFWLVKPGSKPADWGPIDGGHAYCLNPIGLPYARRWQAWYDQERNDCTAYAACIMQSLNNRLTYFAPPVYDHTLTIDEWAGQADEGTSVRATMETLRTLGLWEKDQSGPFPKHGIEVYRWCRSVEQIAWCLDPISQGKRVLGRGYAIMRQSWGPNAFPYATRVDLDVMHEITFRQWGDATLVTDR
jgi:hypothetical protein